MGTSKTVVEQMEETGVEALKKLKELFEAGKLRKIVVKNDNKKVIATFPLYAGMVTLVWAPILSAVGALVAVVSNCSITIEKKA